MIAPLPSCFIVATAAPDALVSFAVYAVMSSNAFIKLARFSYCLYLYLHATVVAVDS